MSLRSLGSHSRSRAALRVEVDQQGLMSAGGQRKRKINSGRRLADASFLIRDAQRSTHNPSVD